MCAPGRERRLGRGGGLYIHPEERFSRRTEVGSFRSVAVFPIGSLTNSSAGRPCSGGGKKEANGRPDKIPRGLKREGGGGELNPFRSRIRRRFKFCERETWPGNFDFAVLVNFLRWTPLIRDRRRGVRFFAAARALIHSGWVNNLFFGLSAYGCRDTAIRAALNGQSRGKVTRIRNKAFYKLLR